MIARFKADAVEQLAKQLSPARAVDVRADMRACASPPTSSAASCLAELETAAAGGGARASRGGLARLERLRSSSKLIGSRQ